MMKNLLVIVYCVLCTINAHGAATIFSGSNVKALKQNLDLNGVVTVQSGGVTPNVTSTSGNKGSLYLTTGGSTFVKQDSGSSTNWSFMGPHTFTGALSANSAGVVSLGSLSSTYLPLAGGTMAGQINMGSQKIVSMLDPTSAQDAATKNYVDTQLAQLNPLAAVYAASTVNIPGTYTNSVSGVCIGDTFQETATVNPFVVDGATPGVGNRVLLKNQTSSFQDGVWTLTTQAVGGVSGAIFTRALDFDSSSDINAGSIIPVQNGTTLAGSSWYQTANNTTCNTSTQTWTQFQAASAAYLLSANNLSDVGTKATAFNNLSPMTTAGDLIYGGASGTGTRLAAGTQGQIFQSNGAAAESWVSNWTPPQITTPSTPSSGFNSLYFKSDGNLYTLNSSGVETKIAGGSISVWSGYHDSSYQWIDTASGSFQDYTINTTGSFTQRINVNFGTVTTASGTRPGIVFTPAASGITYFVQANVGANCATANVVGAIRLWDGATVIGSGGFGLTTSNVQNYWPIPVSGFYTSSSTSAVTLTLQENAAGGGGCNPVIQGQRTGDAIDWIIMALNPPVATVADTGAYYTGAVMNSGTLNATFQTVHFINSSFDTLSSYNTTTGAYTCPSTAKYQAGVSLNMTAATATAAASASIQLFNNGVSQAGNTVYFATAATKPIQPTINAYFTCTSGNTVYVQAAMSAGTTPSIQSSLTANYFWIRRAGN